MIDPKDDNFGAILNCAIRYCLGRRTYMPSLVMEFIQPLITDISDRTLEVMIRDIIECPYYGDPCDKNDWMCFLAKCKSEFEHRGKGWIHTNKPSEL